MKSGDGWRNEGSPTEAGNIIKPNRNDEMAAANET